jgi:sugar lactone lactonase YvrE
MGHLAVLPTHSAHDQDPSLVANLANAPKVTTSTVAPNGDQNPYGVAFVPEGFKPGGMLHAGDLLVSDFNNATAPTGIQGTGTSIVRITPDGQRSLFFQDPSAPGLTTALGVLKSGFVIVGNVPNVGGVAQPGALRILNSNGTVVATLTDSTKLAGPWDLTVVDRGDRALVFVANVLNGTVTRIDLRIPAGGPPVVTGMTTIASGYAFGTNSSAFVVGPTGLAFDAKRDILYVASTADNAIYAVANAAEAQGSLGTGTVVVPTTDPNLHGPLGLVLAANGDLIVSNGDAVNGTSDVNEIVEYTPGGQFVAKMPVDTSGAAGGAFGIALSSFQGQFRFAAVDDNFNTVTVWSLSEELRSH